MLLSPAHTLAMSTKLLAHPMSHTFVEKVQVGDSDEVSSVTYPPGDPDYASE